MHHYVQRNNGWERKGRAEGNGTCADPASGNRPSLFFFLLSRQVPTYRHGGCTRACKVRRLRRLGAEAGVNNESPCTPHASSPHPPVLVISSRLQAWLDFNSHDTAGEGGGGALLTARPRRRARGRVGPAGPNPFRCGPSWCRLVLTSRVRCLSSQRYLGTCHRLAA